MRSIIKNQLGFSLPELTIALGLMGGISLVTMKIIDEQRSNEAYLRGRSEISKAVGLIKNTLNKDENCRQTLAGRTLPTPGSSAVNEIRVNFKRNNILYSQTLLEANKKYSDFHTQSITLERATGAIPNTAELVMRFRIKSRNFRLWGSADPNIPDPDDRIITEKLPMIVYMNTANLITDCSPALSETNAVAKKKFCDSLGPAAVWNDVTKRCGFQDMRCPFGEILINMDKLGGGTCMRIENAINLENLFSTAACNWTGSVRIVNLQGKLIVKCD